MFAFSAFGSFTILDVRDRIFFYKYSQYQYYKIIKILLRATYLGHQAAAESGGGWWRR